MKYKVYGVFAYCPDCGQTNTLQILAADFGIIQKMLDLAAGLDYDMKPKMIEDALENCVSCFDGFGKNLCRLYAAKAQNAERAANIRFQNLGGANKSVQEQFQIEMPQGITALDWNFIVRCFQKRHLFEHNKGVVDRDYIAKSGDTSAIEGRKVLLETDEITKLIPLLKAVASNLVAKMQAL
jgi:hypothetical protein